MLINPDPNQNLDLNPVQLMATYAAFLLMFVGIIVLAVGLVLWAVEAARQRNLSAVGAEAPVIEATDDDMTRSSRVMIWGGSVFVMGLIAISILYAMRV